MKILGIEINLGLEKLFEDGLKKEKTSGWNNTEKSMHASITLPVK